MSTPKVAAIHDLSGYGRCSLSVVLPTLSAMGMECAVMPTAYLSAHTGFAGFSFLDLTEEMKATQAHWRALSLRFDAVYSGFMGSVDQMELVSEIIREFRTERGFAVVDPVMGDNGRLYPTYTDAMCEGLRRLIEDADVITPNLTEASFLLELPYENLPAGREGAFQMVRALSGQGKRSVVLTGVSDGENTLGAAVYDRKTGETDLVLTDSIPGEYSGSGDLFASVITGALLQGKTLKEAAELATRFVRDCAARTCPMHTPAREGLDFEPLLHRLAPKTE